MILFFFPIPDHTVNGILEIAHVHRFLVLTCRDQGRFVTYVGDIGARESGCLFGEFMYIEVL